MLIRMQWRRMKPCIMMDYHYNTRQKQLENFKTGYELIYYPNTDWVKEGMRDFSQNNQFNIMVRGGGQRVR